MSFTTKLGDEFLKVPKLDASGKDWPLWKGRLELSLSARGLMGHLTGTVSKPTNPADGKSAGWLPSSPDEIKAVQTYDKELAEWLEKDAVVKQQIAVVLPDSLFVKLLSKPTAKDYYDTLKAQFEQRSLVVSVELRRKLGEMKLKENGDARTHIEKITLIREELASMGKPVSDEDLFNIIFASLPRSYNGILTSVASSIKLHQKTLTSDDLMGLILDEYDRLALQDGGKSKPKNEDAAFQADGKRWKGRNSRTPITCHNCGWNGHKKEDCWEEGGGKAGQGPKNWKSRGKKNKSGGENSKSGQRANTANEKKDEPDGVWLATVEDASPASAGAATSTTVELYDSGASQHMSPYRDRFINFKSISPHPIQAADKHTFEAIGRGDLPIELPNGKSKTRILLTNVLYAPSMGVTLVSISRLTSAGHAALFRDESCKIFDANKKLLGEVPVRNGLYQVRRPLTSFAGVTNTPKILTMEELHKRMAHIAPSSIREMLVKGMIEGIKLDPTQETMGQCESCEYAKATRKPIGDSRDPKRHENLGDEVHSDLWGPSPTQTQGGKSYYCSFTDDHTRYTSLYLQSAKSDTFGSYTTYEAWLKTQHGANIKRLRSDRGGEYLSDEFSQHLRAKGTERKLTTHDTPQHNGVAERLNRTLIERVRAVLHASGLPKFLWGEAIMHAVYVKNRTATRTLDGKTPYEMLYGKKPNLADLPVWGTRVWVHDDTRTKLDMRAREGRWVGFDAESGAHRVYLEDRRTVAVERNISFERQVGTALGQRSSQPEEESETTNGNQPATPHTAQTPTSSTEAPAPDPLGSNFEHQPPGPRRSTRQRTESPYMRRLRSGEGTHDGRDGDPIIPRGMQRVEEEREEDSRGMGASGEGLGSELGFDEEPTAYAMFAGMSEAEGMEPSTIEDAKTRSDWANWKDAVSAELKSLDEARTWDIVQRPKNKNIVSCKWVFKIKRNAAGEIDKYKARLVARGFTQVYGVDYYETYAPVARLASLRLILAVAARQDWDVDVFDFHSAFLNGKLDADEEIYMELPPGADIGGKDKVAKLRVALYGSKQGALKWYKRLCGELAELGFERMESDWGVFTAHIGEDLLILAAHVDDCTITGSSKELIKAFKAEIASRFRITDLGPISWLLGMKVTRNREARTISLSQESFVEAIITKYNFIDAKPAAVPMDPSMQYTKDQSPTTTTQIAEMKRVPFRSALGSLMYLAVGTRPDVAFAVSTLAQFADNPGWAHWEGVKRVYRYLLGTKKWALTFGTTKSGLLGYADADGASQEHRRAITGFALLVDGGAILWGSRKQELVTLSTAEAEYVAATHTAKEILWLRRFISEVFRPLEHPTTLYCDNQSAIALTKDGSYHARTKHIDIRYHFIRFSVEQGSISFLYCPTDSMVADTLTKALPNIKAKHFASELGLRAAV